MDSSNDRTCYYSEAYKGTLGYLLNHFAHRAHKHLAYGKLELLFESYPLLLPDLKEAKVLITDKTIYFWMLNDRNPPPEVVDAVMAIAQERGATNNLLSEIESCKEKIFNIQPGIIGDRGGYSPPARNNTPVHTFFKLALRAMPAGDFGEQDTRYATLAALLQEKMSQERRGEYRLPTEQLSLFRQDIGQLQVNKFYLLNEQMEALLRELRTRTDQHPAIITTGDYQPLWEAYGKEVAARETWLRMINPAVSGMSRSMNP